MVKSELLFRVLLTAPQMLTGEIPFFAQNVKTMRAKILSGKLKFAKFLTSAAVSFMRRREHFPAVCMHRPQS